MQTVIGDGTQYAICLNNLIFLKACNVPGTIYCNITQRCYDPVKEACDRSRIVIPQQSGCFDPNLGTVLLNNTSEVCPVTNDPFPVTNNCSLYYNCSTSSPILMECPSGFYYDCMLQSCECADDGSLSGSTKVFKDTNVTAVINQYTNVSIISYFILLAFHIPFVTCHSHAMIVQLVHVEQNIHLKPQK